MSKQLQCLVRPVASAAITVSLVSALAACGLLGRELAGAPEGPRADIKTEQQVESMVVADGDACYEEVANGLMVDEPYAPDFNTEEYAALKEQGFVSAATRPLSTVSADVDTASYANLRRMLRDGWTAEEIDTGAVRIEEMLNYFAYDYATPRGDDLFGVTVHVGDCPWNDQTKLVTLGFATAPEATAVAEKGSNLVFLVDVSGSMDSPDKLGLLKDAFGELVSHLGKNDRVSIVTYAGGEEVVLEGARGDQEGKIMRAIRRLRAEGSTNGEAGLQKAYEVARRNYIEGGVNRIVMASDELRYFRSVTVESFEQLRNQPARRRGLTAANDGSKTTVVRSALTTLVHLG